MELKGRENQSVGPILSTTNLAIVATKLLAVAILFQSQEKEQQEDRCADRGDELLVRHRGRLLTQVRRA